MYTFKNAINDILVYYPYYNYNELSYLLEYTIKSEIIPNVILNIKLPKTHSRVEYKKLEFRRARQRGGIKNIGSIMSDVFKSDELINKFQYAKYIYTPDSFNDETFIEHVNDINKTVFFSTNAFNDKNHLLKITYDDRIRKMDDRKTDAPYFSMLNKKEDLLSIVFDEKINDKINNECFFVDFMAGVEKTIRNSYYSSELSKINIEERQDEEIRNWNKIIINIKPKNNEFDENINLWDNIQSDVRKKIFDDIETNKGIKKELYVKYVQNMYFHMDMVDVYDEKL